MTKQIKTLSFTELFQKPIQWFLAVKTAMLQIYSTVYENTLIFSKKKTLLQKSNSQAYITKTYHEGKPIPIGTCVLKRNFSHLHFFDKLKPLLMGPYKILDRLSDVTYELLSQDGSTVHVHRNHLPPYYPKQPLLYPHLRNFMRVSDSTQFQIPEPNKYANSDSSYFNSDESASEDESPQKPLTSFNTSNYDCPPLSSNNNSPIKPYDNSHFKRMINTPQTDISIERSRHLSQDQPTFLPSPIDRTTKTHYPLRCQPQME